MLGRRNKIVLITLFFCLSNVVWGQSQTKTDTIQCNNRNIIIEYPVVNKVNVVNYEEGFFKTINCIIDTAAITIHCGSMVNLPLTDLTDKTVCSDFLLGKDVRIIRGFCTVDMFSGEQGRNKYFREDNYFRYGISIVYENVDEARLNDYEYFFNNVKIQ